jgi:Ca2+-binding RTX toxin-like protein
VGVEVGEPKGRGFIDPTGLRFTDFEHVIGSSGDDRMALWWLNPGGELTAEQEEELQAAIDIPMASFARRPGEIAAKQQERLEAAEEIDQNQQEVLIQGGNGADVIFGTRTGRDTIEGGAGNDKLFAGGFTPKICGGDGDDYVVGGGFGSQLYGGAGADLFGLADNAFVMDASKDDDVVSLALASRRSVAGHSLWMSRSHAAGAYA